MNELELFIIADEALNGVIGQIMEEQWDQPLPPDFATRGDRTYTLREIINYHAYDEAWVPAMLAGKTMEEVGKDTFGKPTSGDVLGDDPIGNYSALSEKAREAARQFPASELDSRIIHYSYGDYPAREALTHIISFRGFRVFDLSKALGFDTTMTPELVTGLWDMLQPRLEEWRQYGILSAPVEVPEEAPLQDRLLGLTGRQPQGKY